MLFTSNCLVPPDVAHKDRIFTSGAVGFEGCVHIPAHPAGGQKDFSLIIEKALTCDPPEELEQGTLVGGFGHGQVLVLLALLHLGVRGIRLGPTLPGFLSPAYYWVCWSISSTSNPFQPRNMTWLR